MDNIPSESSIENVLKELKKDPGPAEAAKEPAAQGEADKELKNLKNVLEQADAQAGLADTIAQIEPKQIAPATENAKEEPLFNENFLKLEQLIKNFKERK